MFLDFSRKLDDPLPLDVLAKDPVLAMRTKKSRSLWMSHRCPGVDFDSASSNTNVATATLTRWTTSGMDGGQLDIEAHGTGTATIEFFEKGKRRNLAHNKITVHVYPALPVYVNVFLVEDANGKPMTTFSDIGTRLKDINSFLVPQANIRFLLNVQERLKTSADLRMVDKSQEEMIWRGLMKSATKYDPAPDHVNLFVIPFFDWRDVCETEMCSKDVMGVGPIGSYRCLVEDMEAEFQGPVIAHEILHSLGARHDHMHSKALMNRVAGEGTLIYPETVIQIRGLP